MQEEARSPSLEPARQEEGSVVEGAFRAALDVGPALHHHMVRARVISGRMVALQRAERVGFHRASMGDEAVIVGAVLAAVETDWIFPGPREWYAALARGLSLRAYVHHAFGSSEDPARGHAAPDHLPARSVRVVPPSGVLGAHLPQAVGAAWATRLHRSADGAAMPVATVCLFGSEVTESGDFHNAMNFAGVFRTPSVFVVRASETRPGPRVVDRAVAYGLASARVDGSDALAVVSVVRAALARAREGKGATLVEAVVGAAPASVQDSDLASPRVLLDLLGTDDPIARLRRVLAREQLLDPKTEAEIVEDVSAELDQAITAAEQAGAPSPTTIFDHVYADVPVHLAAQRQSLRNDSGGF
jgi:pyruvate dehydrogenase E1 component alpha subunit